VRRDFDNVEIRIASERAPHLESVQLRIAVLLFLAPETMAILSIQWGNNLLPIVVIWTLGSIIIWRARRFHISATYVVSFFLFAFLRSWITGDPWQAEVAPITGADVSTLCFLHDYRSEDDCSISDGPMCGCVLRGRWLNLFLGWPGRLRSHLRIVS